MFTPPKISRYTVYAANTNRANTIRERNLFEEIRYRKFQMSIKAQLRPSCERTVVVQSTYYRNIVKATYTAAKHCRVELTCDHMHVPGAAEAIYEWSG